MGFDGYIVVFLSIILQLLGITTAEINFIEHYCNFKYDANYTSNSQFQKYLDTLPSFITSDASFHSFTIGESEKVYVIALCRADVKPDACRSCLIDSNSKLRELCPSEKESIGWSDNCMLRYSDRTIFNSVSTFPNAYAYNPTMAKNVDPFNKVVRSLLDHLNDKASGGNSVIKFASGNMSTADETIYGLVQCTPDLNPSQCKNCLVRSFGYLRNCCNGKVGGRVVMPSCNFRYEIGRFYDEPHEAAVAPPPPPKPIAPPLSPPSKGQGGKNQCISNYSIRNNGNKCESHLVDYLLSHFTIGESDDKVNVIALCRGDVKPDVCQSCLVDSSSKLRELCPHEKDSIAWSDNCMLRYSDRAIFSNVSTSPYVYAYNPTMAKNVIGFNKVLRNLLDNLSVEASQGDSVLKFATGNMSVGGRVLMPSCNFRYEIGSFYNETQKAVVTPSPQPVGSTAPDNVLEFVPSVRPPANGKGGKNNSFLITLSAIFAAAVIATF
ncbi:hypothetical protein POM88_040390 [Heracleum sosnowskyi]|uniref:Gnk2-homologous domain-containing protein n=1 Tax=Heracleum sosnowskyi TaxID=360622 RepID=A0AAD8HEH6_9APIA|nr:hypothetical protein POM88_040390 [Heracleum sosnowskyi]